MMNGQILGNAYYSTVPPLYASRFFFACFSWLSTNRLCEILHCRPEDIAEFQAENGSNKAKCPGCPFGCRPAYSAQFSILSSGTRANSRTLFVTKTAPSALACPAISISSGPMGVPRL